MKYNKILLAIIISCLCLSIKAQPFRHPGILHSQEALDRIYALSERRAMPSFGSLQILKNTPESSAGYCIKGPFEYISRGGQYGYTKDPCERDFNAAYYNALMWICTKDKTHAIKSMEIIRAYAATLKGIGKPDDPLCAGLQGFILVNAAEIMRYTYTSSTYSDGWNKDDTKKTEAMFRNVFLPILTTFYQTKPYTNGNWGIAVTKAQIAFGVFLNDRQLYTTAKEFFYNGKDNGSLPNYVDETGQLQESGRDQQHCMLGIGCLAEIAEVAWNQGEDLYSALDNRIMKGYEYLSKSNLGFDVPFKTWIDITGKYSNWQSLGQDGMGRFRSVFEIGYNHYVNRKNMEMPYTKIVLGRVRPEGPGFTCDNPGFGTLLFYLGEKEKQPEDGCISEHFMKPTGWTYATSFFKPVNGTISLVGSGVGIQKKALRYNAGKFPYIAVKIPHLPKQGNQTWLQLSYSVASAPEFWRFSTADAFMAGNGIYVFKVAGSRSNNGTLFTTNTVPLTVILDFGETAGEAVAIDWLRSYENMEEIKKEL